MTTPAAKEKLHFGTAPSSVGTVLVASSDKGICAIFLDTDTDALVAELRREFPAAAVLPGDREYDAIVSDVVGLVEAPASDCKLRLDTRGGDFEQFVWAAIRATPPGTTVSYADIARLIGSTRGAEPSIARVCSSNRLAVAVPCHRVVGEDGSSLGYRWGDERRRMLLGREAGGRR